MERLLEKIVMVYNCQKQGTVLFGCQGQSMDGYSALANYNSIAEEIKEFLIKNCEYKEK